MDETVLDTTANPKIIVEAQDRLTIRGWDRTAIKSAAPKDSVRVEVDDDTIRVTGSSRLDLRVPHGASLEVTGFAETIVRGVAGGVRVLSTGESLTLREVGDTVVESVAHDLTARSVNGNLKVESVGRYANVRGVSGDFHADHIDSHLNIREVAGSITAEAGGNANLYLDVQTERSIRVSAAGVITCRVFPDLNARVRIMTSGSILVKVGEVREDMQDSYEARFGDGAGELVLEGGGRVTLAETSPERETPAFDFDFNIGNDLAGIGAGIGEQITEQLGMIEEELEARMSGFTDLVNSWELPADKVEKIQQKTQEKVEKAQQKIRRAQERAARKIADAQRRAEKDARRVANIERRVRGKSFSFDIGNYGKSAKPKSDPVSEEERLMILNMVAEKKISLEEAEALLSALEGK
jgi:hypothetical protein